MEVIQKALRLIQIKKIEELISANDSVKDNEHYRHLLATIEATKINLAQAKIHVGQTDYMPEMVSRLMEYLDAVNKLKDHENQLLIMYLCEVKQGMAELKAMMRAMSINTAGHPI